MRQFNKKKKGKIQGHILMYVLFILMFASLLFYGLFQYIELYSSQTYLASSKSKVYADINSVLLFELNKPSVNENDDYLDFSKYLNDSLNPPIVNTSYWGVLTYIRIQKEFRNKVYLKCVLSGNMVNNDNEVCLYLANNKEALCLTGETIIKGDVYLPTAGMKTTYLRNRSNKNKPKLIGEIFQSSEKLPALKDRDSNPFLGSHEINRNSYDHQVIPFSEIYADTLVNSFLETTLLIESNEAINLRDVYANGNIIFYSEKEVLVYPSCSLTDVILMAPTIRFLEGFEGSLQAFGTDSLIVEQDSYFHFPSVLSLIVIQETENKGFLNIDGSSTIEGAVLGLRQDNVEMELSIRIGSATKITGQVYSEGSLEIRGEVIGSVYCDHFVLNTPSSKYINYLEDMMISAPVNSEPIINLVQYDNNKTPKKVIKELY